MYRDGLLISFIDQYDIEGLRLTGYYFLMLLKSDIFCFAQYLGKSVPPVIYAHLLLALTLDPFDLDPSPVGTGNDHLALFPEESCCPRLC